MCLVYTLHWTGVSAGGELCIWRVVKGCNGVYTGLTQVS